MKKGILVILLAGSIFADSFIRIINCPQYCINDSLLSRIQRSNYNYVVVPFNFRVSDDIVGNGDVYENLKSDMRNATIALSKYNLKIIPLIPSCAKWALQWKIIQIYENPKVGMNTIVANDEIPSIVNDTKVYEFKNNLTTQLNGYNKLFGKLDAALHGEKYEPVEPVYNKLNNSLCELDNPAAQVTMGTNSIAYEPEGVDKSVIDILNALKEGFEGANVDYDLEYVHFEHDESNFMNWSLIGGIAEKCGTAYPYLGNFARGEIAMSEVNFIDSAVKTGTSIEIAYQSLLAQEVYRRILQIESVFGYTSNGYKTKLMIYADAFDDQNWGGTPWKVKNGNEINEILMGGVINLPSLNKHEKGRVKNEIVMVVWCNTGNTQRVDKIQDWLSQEDYNTDAAFKRFNDYGYKFIYCGSLQYGKKSANQLKEFADLSIKYSNYMGYFGAAWDADYDIKNPHEKWNVIEYIYSLQKGYDLPNSAIDKQSIYSSGANINFSLTENDYVKVEVLDLSGRYAETLYNGFLFHGKHSFRISKSRGMYLVKIENNGKIFVKQVIKY